MISKWFMGVKAQSKGYFKHINSRYDYRKGKHTMNPAFTKQSALAPSFNTKEEALEAIEKFTKEAQKLIDECTIRLADIKETRKVWDTLDYNGKLDFLNRTKISPEYTPKARHGYGNYKSRLYASNCKNKPLSDDERTAFSNIGWDEEIEKRGLTLKNHEARHEWITTKLLVRECELELKFMENERRTIKWQQRSENNTAGSYCVACGGAVPGIPQLVIGSSPRNDQTHICAICMGKLAEEAKIQAGKVPDDIMEHYQTDRFLRALE